MNRSFLAAGLVAGALGLSSVVGLAGANAMPGHDAKSPTTSVRVCATPAKVALMSCHAWAVADAQGQMIRSDAPLPAAFTPADIQAAYKLKGLKSHGTVAIIDAYGYSKLEADLKVFRSTYGLPPCTVKNGCLTIMDERGGTNYPPDNAGWDLEQALDVDMVSSACPDCKILVVQGKAPNVKSLGHAVNTAAKTKGVVSISNSYGGGNRPNKPYYHHDGVAIVASTGDAGFNGGQYPSSDTHVIAVGGTSVFKDSSSRGFHESAWAGAGSGCTTWNRQPWWQKDAKTTCEKDAASDVSGAADPGNGGLSVYYNGHFQQVGGTSESSPLIGAVFALAGKVTGAAGRYPYLHQEDLYDVTTGSNGSCGPPVCDAGKGWDGPTGLGTPHGIGAF